MKKLNKKDKLLEAPWEKPEFEDDDIDEEEYWGEDRRFIRKQLEMFVNTHANNPCNSILDIEELYEGLSILYNVVEDHVLAYDN